jgi:hypothetical protein
MKQFCFHCQINGFGSTDIKYHKDTNVSNNCKANISVNTEIIKSIYK